MKNVKKMSDNELAYARKDLWEVIGIQEQTALVSGPASVPKLPVYWDQMHDVIGEINRREQKKLSAVPRDLR